MMTCPLTATGLTEEQKAQVVGILSVGCDRQTAADYVGCSLSDIRRAMRGDPSFSADIRRAEASVELVHMRNVQELAKAKKDWRASVWWLERRAPERFARRSPGVVTARHLQEYLAILTDILQSDVQVADDRARVLARLEALAASVDSMLWEEEACVTETNVGGPKDQSDGTWPSLVVDQDEPDSEKG